MRAQVAEKVPNLKSNSNYLIVFARKNDGACTAAENVLHHLLKTVTYKIVRNTEVKTAINTSYQVRVIYSCHVYNTTYLFHPLRLLSLTGHSCTRRSGTARTARGGGSANRTDSGCGSPGGGGGRAPWPTSASPGEECRTGSVGTVFLFRFCVALRRIKKAGQWGNKIRCVKIVNIKSINQSINKQTNTYILQTVA